MQIPLNQISDSLDKTVVNLDETRAADLDELSQVRSAKFAGLARDRARLVSKLGETDPRVQALDRALALHTEALNGYRAESASTLATPPQVNSRSWALYGNVVDATRAPVEGVTVALYRNEAWDERLGYACTDAQGYFALTLADASKTDNTVSIHVLKNNKTIYVDPRPVIIQAARAEYREVVIGKTPAQTCDPPSGNRKDPPSTVPSRKSSEPTPSEPAPVKPGPAAQKKGVAKKEA